MKQLILIRSGKIFDVGHEGRGGWTSGRILSEIEDWLIDAGDPDIVLLSSPCGNDALKGLPYDKALFNVNDIIDILQAVNPQVTIIIEQLAPGHSTIMTPELTAYLEQMKHDVVAISAAQSTSTSSVIAVDMFPGFRMLCLQTMCITTRQVPLL